MPQPDMGMPYQGRPGQMRQQMGMQIGQLMGMQMGQPMALPHQRFQAMHMVNP